MLFSAKSWLEVYEHAQTGFDKISKWLMANLLTLNTDKTKFITFQLRKTNKDSEPTHTIVAHTCSQINHKCSCPKLSKTNNIKYLGILIDDSLSFKPHINMLATRLRKMIYIFKNLRHVADEKILKTVYFALCQSIITYCITSWGGAAKSIIIELERAQRAILKVSNFLPIYYSTTDLYEKCQVLSIRRLFVLKTMLKKHSEIGYNPTLMVNKRRVNTICHNPLFNTEFSHRFFCFLGSHLYNKLNGTLSLYSLNKHECKTSVYKWLLNMDYQATEDILNICS